MSEIYRDRTEGAAARRQELLRRRRDELATMPHAVRRVVVARSARIAAGTAIAFAGVGLLVAAAVPSLATWMTTWLPGIQPAPLSTLLSATWIVGLVAWAFGRARVEHRFAVAMSHYVLPGEDLDHDIERLDHERPDEIARQMAHGLEVKSAAWPVIAAALVVPASALYVVAGARKHGWPVMSEFEASLAAHSHALIAIAIAGAIAAIVMTRRTARLPGAAVIAGSVALLSALAGIGLVVRGSSAAWWLAGLTVITGTIGYLARRLRVERVLIAADDPAAGSELFTIRGFLRSVRQQLASAHGALRRVRGYRWWRFGAVAAGVVPLYLVLFARPHKLAEPPAVKPGAVMPQAISEVDHHATFDPGYKLTRMGNRFAIELTLDGNAPLDIPSLSDLGMVPSNWHANVTVELGSSDASLAVSVVPEGKGQTLNVDSLNPRVVFDINNCDGHVQPLGLHVEPRTHDQGSRKVTLYVTPRLDVASCGE